MTERFRIDELQAVTAKALDKTPVDGVLSRRVRAIPDARTIRYYTTIGLIDRPAEMRGRTAFYDRRHVLQLVAIKRLQAEGRSLAEVQEKLAGATDRTLAQIADLPDGFWEGLSPNAKKNTATDSADEAARLLPSSRAAGSTKARPGSDSFWKAEPGQAAELQLADSHSVPIPCVRLPVANGVSLEVVGVDPSRLTSQRAASLQPLLNQVAQELERLGLIAGVHSDSPSTSQSTDPFDQEK